MNLERQFQGSHCWDTTLVLLGFFSEERKGDIIARMSGDVQEVENSIMSSLDMLKSKM